MLTTSAIGATRAMVAARNKIDHMIVRYDGWFLVLLAILMVLAFALLAAMAIWCLAQGRGHFTGNWSWNQWGVSVFVECR
ncbi:hypothetical protein ACIQC5_05725 [Paenarthrobacter sp. NPDC092416]|uniref:hypothetical protein n=1 Tax=Paenarthrobacter sp. NPDC092416 TaxID=3364386 RepID=UPI0038306266